MEAAEEQVWHLQSSGTLRVGCYAARPSSECVREPDSSTCSRAVGGRLLGSIDLKRSPDGVHGPIELGDGKHALFRHAGVGAIGHDHVGLARKPARPRAVVEDDQQVAVGPAAESTSAGQEQQLDFRRASKCGCSQSRID